MNRYRQLRPDEVHPRERYDAQRLLTAMVGQVNGLRMPELHFIEPIPDDAPRGDDYELTMAESIGGYFEAGPGHPPMIWIQRGLGYWQLAALLGHEVGHAMQAAFPGSFRYDNGLMGKNAEATADRVSHAFMRRLVDAHVAAEGVTAPASI